MVLDVLVEKSEGIDQDPRMKAMMAIHDDSPASLGRHRPLTAW